MPLPADHGVFNQRVAFDRVLYVDRGEVPAKTASSVRPLYGHGPFPFPTKGLACISHLPHRVGTSQVLCGVSLQVWEDDLVILGLRHAVEEQFIQVTYPVLERRVALRGGSGNMLSRRGR